MLKQILQVSVTERYRRDGQNLDRDKADAPSRAVSLVCRCQDSGGFQGFFVGAPDCVRMVRIGSLEKAAVDIDLAKNNIGERMVQAGTYGLSLRAQYEGTCHLTERPAIYREEP